MNPSITSKEEILQVCRNIVAEKGLSALNMRLVADTCHIALGTLYNYFSNKDELMLSTVESVWKDIFHMNQKHRTDFSFSEYVKYIFECVQKGAEEYPNFFTAHSINIASSQKGQAKSMMELYFRHMKDSMLEVLKSDEKVNRDIFSVKVTESEFIDFVLDNLLLLLVKGKTSCDLFIEVIRRTVYK